MAWYPFGTDLDEMKEGLPGPPGNGFKLTEDGDYDMERRRLKNMNDPIDATDSCSKGYVDQLRSAVVHLSEVSLVYRQGAYDGKGKIIGNVSDPKGDMNAVNKRYFENNALILNDKGFLAKNNIIGDVKDPELSQDVVTKNYLEKNTLILDDNYYDLKSARFKNMSVPLDRYDGVNKLYVDRKTKINDKKSNMLQRDSDGLFVPSLEVNGVYNFENKRLTFVANPIINKDAATKEYVDGQNFYATIKERFYTYTTNGFKTVKFDLMSSKLLDPEMKLMTTMYMKITIYLSADLQMVKPLIKLEIANQRIIQRPVATDDESVTCFAFGKKDDVVKLSILSDGDSNRLKPYLHIEKIEFI